MLSLACNSGVVTSSMTTFMSNFSLMRVLLARSRVIPASPTIRNPSELAKQGALTTSSVTRGNALRIAGA